MKESGQEQLEKRSATVEDLVAVRQDDHYVARIKSQFLTTPQGNVIKSKNQGIFDRIKADLRSQGELTVENGIIVSPQVHSAYLLVSTQLDSVERGEHPFRDVMHNLQGDPIFNVSAGPELFMYQLLAWTHAVDYLRKLSISFKRWTGYTASERSELADAFSNALGDFTSPELSVLATLFSIHNNHFVYPVLFLKNLCTAREYARAIYAGSPDASRKINYTPEPGELFAVPKNETQQSTQDQASAIISSYRDDCAICAHYLEAMKG